MAPRAHRKLPRRGLCPNCGRKGLGGIVHSVVRGRAVSFRSCRYCAEQVDVEVRGADRSRDADPGGEAP